LSCRPARGRLRAWLALAGIGFAAALLALLPTRVGAEASDRVLVTQVATEITPVVADQVHDGIREASEKDCTAYVIELDTPGGLVTSMREIIEDILASEIPVIVYVSPQGARAASAGAVITLASHVALMAPGTSIGAATPVGLEGDDVGKKIVNDAAAQAESLARLRGRNVEFASAMVREGESLPVDEAVERDVVDAGASSLEEALRVADGRTVTVAGNRDVEVSTAGAAVERADMGLFRRILQTLANPNLAYLLLTLATLGLIYELASPGVGIAGVAGAVCLLLALFSLAILPVNIAGLLLLAVAAALFAAELFAPGIGGFAFGGAAVLVLAALFLFDDAQGVSVDLAVALPTAVVMAVLAIVAGRLVARSYRAPVTASGPGRFVDHLVTVRDVGPGPDPGRTGRAFTEGTWWNVRSTGEPLVTGARARVVGQDGLTLLVEPLPPDDPDRQTPDGETEKP
jgi:membrane-bound serine protease (ClpP class)